jgi:hypothetical protein
MQVPLSRCLPTAEPERSNRGIVLQDLHRPVKWCNQDAASRALRPIVKPVDMTQAGGRGDPGRTEGRTERDRQPQGHVRSGSGVVPTRCVSRCWKGFEKRLLAALKDVVAELKSLRSDPESQRGLRRRLEGLSHDT